MTLLFQSTNFIIDKLSNLLYNNVCYAVVAKLADALDSGSSARKGMEVQVLSTAPLRTVRPPGLFSFALVRHE